MNERKNMKKGKRIFIYVRLTYTTALLVLLLYGTVKKKLRGLFPRNFNLLFTIFYYIFSRILNENTARSTKG